jgi:hypothetical protein
VDQGGADNGGQQDAGDSDGEDERVLGRGVRDGALPQEREQVDAVGTGDRGDGRHGQEHEREQGADAAHPQRGCRLARLDSRCDGKGNGRDGQKGCEKEEPGHRNLPRG